MNNFKKMRRSSGYKTVKEAAIDLNISKGMLYQIEEGYKRPSINLAIRMTKLYKCTLSEIFLGIHTTDSE